MSCVIGDGPPQKADENGHKSQILGENHRNRVLPKVPVNQEVIGSSPIASFLVREDPVRVRFFGRFERAGDLARAPTSDAPG